MGEAGSSTLSEQGAFERALRLYAETGLSAERQVLQLRRAGFPLEWMRARFPELPESVWAMPVPLDAKLREVLLRAAESLQAGRGLTAPQPIERVLPGVLKGRVSTGARADNNAGAATAVTSPAAPSAVGADGVSFQYVPLIQCSFPHADPGDQPRFTRRNGWLELTLSTTRAQIGLPYGVPARLLTIYCATEALRTRSPEIFLGASVHEFLRRLDVPITRGERGSLRVYANQLLRLIQCAISIDENMRDPNGRTGLHIRQTLFVEEARLWWDEQSGVGQGSSLVLSSVLFESMLERSAPLSTQAIRQLRKSPMDLDVYAWLAHRLFQLSRPSTISWAQLSGQFGHGYALLRKFRAFFAASLQRVLEVYPEAHVKLTPAGLMLLPSRPHVPRTALGRR